MTDKALFFLYALALLVAGWLAYVAYARWYLMLSSMGDLGLIDAAAYNTAHGAFMLTTTYRVEVFWQEHFMPIMLLLSGYYLFDDGFWFVYFWQSLSYTLAAIPLYLLVRHFWGRGWAPVAVALAFLLNEKMHLAMLFDYHPAAHIGLFALSALYAGIVRRWGVFVLFAALLLSCREDASFILFVIGLYIAFVRREWRWGLGACGVGVVYFLILMKFVVPYFGTISPESLGDTGYIFAVSYAWLGATPADIVRNFVESPLAMASKIVQYERASAWYALAAQFGYMPFFSLGGLLLLAPTSLSLLLNDYPARHLLIWHYPLLVVPLWFVAFTLGVATLRRWADGVGGRCGTWCSPRIARHLSRILFAIALVYAGSLAWFAVAGPVNTQIGGVRIVIENSDRPLTVLVVSLVLALLLSPSKALGETLAARIPSVAALYLLAATAYFITPESALPWASAHTRYFDADKVAHAEVVHRTLASIPRHASLIAGQGPYTLALHNPNTFLYRGFDQYPLSERPFTYLLFDVKTPVNEPFHRGHIHGVVEELLLKEPNYGVVAYEDGVYLFKKGAPKRRDRELFLSEMSRYTADQLGGSVGVIEEDPSSPYGRSRRARTSDPAGHMIYGPYITLFAGSYVAEYRLMVDPALDGRKGPVVFLDVVADEGRTTYASRLLTDDDFGKGGEWVTISLPYAITEEKKTGVEFRVRFEGNADVRVDGVRYTFDEATSRRILERSPAVVPTGEGKSSVPAPL